MDRRSLMLGTLTLALSSNPSHAAWHLTGYATSFFKWITDKVGGLAVEEGIKRIFSEEKTKLISETNVMLRSGGFTNFSNSNIYYNGSTIINNCFYVAESPNFERGACGVIMDFSRDSSPSMIEGAAIFSLMRKAARFTFIDQLPKAEIRNRLLPRQVILPPQPGDVYQSYQKPIVYPTEFGAVAIDWQRTGDSNGIAKIGIKKDGGRNFDTDELAWCFREGTCTS
jgi:hypothetical protein